MIESIDASGMEAAVRISGTSVRTSNVALALCALTKTESQGQVRAEGKEVGLTVWLLFLPPFHQAKVEQHFLVRLFVLDEEAIEGPIQGIVPGYWRLDGQGRRHSHIADEQGRNADSRSSVGGE